MIQILRPDQNLEEIRRCVELSVQRPVLIAGGEYWQGENTLYRFPNQTRYTTTGRLELFLSQLTPGVCVKVEEVPVRGVPAVRRVCYFDLTPCDTIRLVYPVYREEHPDPWGNPHFKAAGLTSPLNGGVQTIFLTPDDRVVDPRLEPFVVNHHKTRSTTGALGVKFAVSNAIEAPKILKAGWHTGIAFEGRSYVAQTLQAPGHYHSETTVLYSPQAQNRMCLVDTDPGSCVVCGGSSGERAHLGVVVGGNPSWPDGMVCRACYPQVVREWGVLLVGWTPPEKSPST